MGLIKTLSLGVGVNSKGVKKGLGKASKDVKSWASSIPKIASGVAIGTGIASVFGRAMDGLGALVTTTFETAINTETMETSFGVLLGGAAQAKKTLKDLNDFSDATPFTFDQVTTAGRNFLAFGFQADELTEKLSMAGDIASGLNIDYGAFTESIGKMKVGNVIQGEDLNQLAGMGIDVFGGLADVLNVSSSEIKKLGSEGQIHFSDIETMFANMTSEGGKFQNMMEKQSQTVAGKWSTIRGKLTTTLSGIGTSIFDTFNVKSIMDFAITKIGEFKPMLENTLTWFSSLKPVFMQVFSTLISYVSLVWDVWTTVFSAIGSFIGSWIGGTFDGFLRSVVAGLAMIEFGFMNWRKVGLLAMLKLGYGLVSFGNQTIHFLTVAIPYAVGYFARNFSGIMLTVAANALTVFENLADNIVTLFKNIPSMLAGDFSGLVNLVDLDRGFIDLVDEAFEVPERIEGKLETSLRTQMESLQKELGAGLEDHVNRKLEVAFPTGAIESPEIPEVKIPEVEVPNVGGASPTGENKFAKLAEVNSQDARDTLLRFRGLGIKPEKDAVAKESRDIQKETLAEIKKANKAKVTTEKEYVIP